jgi:hypothetical protein
VYQNIKCKAQEDMLQGAIYESYEKYETKADPEDESLLGYSTV